MVGECAHAGGCYVAAVGIIVDGRRSDQGGLARALYYLCLGKARTSKQAGRQAVMSRVVDLDLRSSVARVQRYK